MKPSQKIIKYIALAFATILIIAIFSTAIKLTLKAGIIFGILKHNHNSSISSEIRTIEVANEEIEELNINLSYSNLQIKNGTAFYIETNYKNINCIEQDNKLEIKDENEALLGINNNDSKIILYIPTDFCFEKVKITTGAGKIEIEDLKAQELKFELGAGEVAIKEIYVYDEAKIDAGAGKLTINNGSMQDLKLSLGVGKADITSEILGDSSVEAGIGKLKINLLSALDSYKIKVSKGIGNIKVNNEQIREDTTIGDGKNYIKLNGGIGNITIDLEK